MRREKKGGCFKAFTCKSFQLLSRRIEFGSIWKQKINRVGNFARPQHPQSIKNGTLPTPKLQLSYYDTQVCPFSGRFLGNCQQPTANSHFHLGWLWSCRPCGLPYLWQGQHGNDGALVRYPNMGGLKPSALYITGWHSMFATFIYMNGQFIWFCM